MTLSDRTSNSHNFPVETALRDGTPVLIRPIQPTDKHFLEVGMEHLSPEARYFRFFRAISKLSPDFLRHFTEIDHVNHEAIGALCINETEPMGVARYIRKSDQDTTAEVAVTVLDSYQGKGLGTMLLAILAHLAVKNGVQEFYAAVLTSNLRMLGLFNELGGRVTSENSGELDMLIPLYENASSYPATAVGDVFRQASALLINEG